MKMPLTHAGKLALVAALLTVLVVVVAAGGRRKRHKTAAEPVHPPAVDPGRQRNLPVRYTSAELETVYDRAAVLLWSLESSCGTDPDWKLEGEDGERGQLQATPIWLDDYERIFGVRPDPMDTHRMLTRYVPNWLWWWRHELQLEPTLPNLVALYQRGPSAVDWESRAEPCDLSGKRP